MTSLIGYLKLLITRSILSSPLDFEIKRVACTNFCLRLQRVIYKLSHLITKPTKLPVCPAKTQISLDIRPDCSESSLCSQWVARVPILLHADTEHSDWVDAETDPRLSWAHRSFCWFCHEAAQSEIILCKILHQFLSFSVLETVALKFQISDWDYA